MTGLPDDFRGPGAEAASGICAFLRERGDLRGLRCLLCAPPGEILDLAHPLLEAVGPGGKVRALLRGEPFLHGPVPPGLTFLDRAPGSPRDLEGPFDLALGFGSLPFIEDPRAFLEGLRRALRPGGRLLLDLPARGFQVLLQACLPGAGAYELVDAAWFEAELEAQGFRGVEIRPLRQRRRFRDFAALMQDLCRPEALSFEGELGAARLESLREALAEALGDRRDFTLVFRRLRVHAMR